MSLQICLVSLNKRMHHNLMHPLFVSLHNYFIKNFLLPFIIILLAEGRGHFIPSIV